MPWAVRLFGSGALELVLFFLGWRGLHLTGTRFDYFNPKAKP